MTTIQVRDFYSLGMLISNLKFILATDLKNSRPSDYKMILDGLRTIQHICDKYYLNEKLCETLNSVIKSLQNLPITNNQLPIRRAQLLHNNVTEWKTIIGQDLELFNCYTFDHDSTTNIVKLEDEGAKGFFGKDVWNKLTPIAKHDFEQSAKCLVCGFATASGILALRGLEDVTRTCYKNLAVKNEMESFKSFGQVIDALENLKFSKSVIGYLRYVKDEMRNPINHPDLVLSIREADRIFSAAQEATVKIISKMK